MRSVPVVGCAVLLLASLANRAGPGRAEPVQQEEVKQKAAADPDQMQQVLNRLDAIESLVEKHTAMVIDSLTDATPPAEIPVAKVPGRSIPDQPLSFHPFPESGSQDFARARQESSDGAQSVLYVYGSEGWEQVNAFLIDLTEEDVEHPHIVDLLECTPEERQIAEAGKTEWTDQPWLQTLHENGTYGPIWYPLQRMDSTEKYETWLRGNDEPVQGDTWVQNDYIPASYSSNRCAT